MTDPFFDSLAAALAGQAVTALSAAGTKALSKLRELVRRRSERDPEMQAALAAAEESAEPPQIRALAERLDQAATADPEFDQELRAEGATVHGEFTASSGGVVNVMSGHADKLIQARDIQGNITLN